MLARGRALAGSWWTAAPGCPSLIGNVLWIVLFGWELFLAHRDRDEGAQVPQLRNTSQDIRAQLDAGEFRAPAVSPAERVAYLPDGPTLSELGLPALTYSTSLFGLGAPVGTPPELIAELETAMRAGLADPAVRAQLDEAYVPEEFIGAEEFRSMLDEIVDVYGPVAEEQRGG